MGNSWPRLCREDAKKKRCSSVMHSIQRPSASERGNRNRSSRKTRSDEISLEDQALAAAFLLQRSRGSFARSCSTRHGASKKPQLPRSSSSAAKSLTDPLLSSNQLVNQGGEIEDLETTHFVLVHGGGFGAWCWYKTITLLEETGFKVDTINLAGSGIDSIDVNNITSLSQYVEPLSDFLGRAPREDKVILVGHDIGGACISYAMEKFPERIAKAIFIAATMPRRGQSALDVFSAETVKVDLMVQAQEIVYAKGKEERPTSIELKKAALKDLLFNNSPSRDVALASVSMRPIPFAPLLEKLWLSDEKYGSVRRFYIQTAEDNAVLLDLQRSMVETNPPEQVFYLKGSDHSPFFSRSQALHRVLVEIAKKQPYSVPLRSPG